MKVIKKYFWLVLLTFIVMPVMAKAEDFSYSYKAYTCPGLLDATGNPTLDNTDDCILDYLDGVLDNQEIAAGSTLNPKQYIMLVLNYTQNNASAAFDTMILGTKFNTDVFDLGMVGTAHISTPFIDNDNPMFGRRTPWTLYYSGVSTAFPGTFTVQLSTSDGLNNKFSKSSGALVFMFFKVKDVPGASTAEFSINKLNTSISDATNALHEWTYNDSKISFNISGGSANTSTDLSSLVLKGKTGSGTVYDYTPQLGFTANTTDRSFSVIIPGSIVSFDLSAVAGFNKTKIFDIEATVKEGSARNTTIPLSSLSKCTTSTPGTCAAEGHVGEYMLQFYTQAEDTNVSLSYYTIYIKQLSNNTEFDKFDVYSYGESTPKGTLLTSTIPTSNRASTAVKYSYTAKFAVPKLYIDATAKEAPLARVEGEGVFNLPKYLNDGSSNGINETTITVYAEDCNYTDMEAYGITCTSEEYKLQVTREEPSHIRTLSSLTVDGELIAGFAPNVTSYTYGTNSSTTSGAFGVRTSKTSVEITATLTDRLGTFTRETITNVTDDGTTKVGRGTCNLQLGANECRVVVKDEDGEEQPYVINIYRFLDNNTLSNLTINPYRKINGVDTIDPTLGKLTEEIDEEAEGTGIFTYTYGPRTTKMDITATVKAIVGNTVKASIVLTAEYNNNTTATVGSVTNGVATYSPTFDITNQDSNLKKLTIKVTSEDGNLKEYPITFIRGESSDTTLKGLTVTGSNGTTYDLLDDLNAVTTFDPEHHTYNVIVDPEVTSITVNATKNDYTPYEPTVTGNTSLRVGSNTVTITVKAENKQTGNYTLTVTRLPYDKAELEGISVKLPGSDTNLITDFNKTNSGPYVVEVNYDVTKINFEYTFNSDYQMTITGTETGEKNLVTGDSNVYTINVVSQATDARRQTKSYTVKVVRKKSTETRIDSISLLQNDGPTLTAHCNHDTLICKVDGDAEVKNSFALANDSSIKVNFAAPAASYDSPRATGHVDEQVVITTDDSYNHVKNEIPIVVQAEDPTVSPVTYTLELYRERSSNNVLDTFRVYETVGGVERTTPLSCKFADKVYACTITVDVETTKVRVDSTTSHAKARVTYSSGSETGNVYDMGVDESSKTILATVTPENGGDTQTYTVTINRTLSNDNLLKMIYTNADVDSLEPIYNFDTTGDNRTYTLSVKGTQTSIDIKAEANDPKSTVTVTGLTDTNPRKDILEVNKTLKYGDSVDSANPENTVIITVTSEANQPKNYTIYVIRRYNEDNVLKDLKVDGTTLSDFDITGVQADYNLATKEYNEASIEIRAILNDPLAYVQSILVNGVAVDFTSGNDVTFTANLKTGNNIIYVNTNSHDKDHFKEYSINVFRKRNTDRTIESIKINTGGGNYEMAYCDTTTRMCYGDLDEKTPVVVPYNYKVASDTTIEVNLKAPQTSYDAPTTASVTSTNLETSVVEDGVRKQVRNEVPINVQAEHPDYASIYTLYVNRTMNNDDSLVRVNVYASDSSNSAAVTNYSNFCILSNNECTISVKRETDEFRLEGILGDTTNANVVFSYEDTHVTPNEVKIGPKFAMPKLEAYSNMEIHALVTAEDGSHTDYTIYIERTLSNNSFLSGFKTNAKQPDPNVLVSYTPFSSTTTEYDIYVDSGQSEITIEATAYDTKAKVINKGETIPEGDAYIFNRTYTLNEPGTDTTIVLVVNPEDGEEGREYTLKVHRASDKNSKISMIYVNGLSIDNFMSDTVFDPTVTSYTLDLQEYNTTNLIFSATPDDTTYGTVKINGTNINATTPSVNVVLQTVKYHNEDNYANVVTVIGYAQDTNEKTEYTVNIRRKANTSTSITKVEMKYQDEDKVERLHEATCNLTSRICEISVPNYVTEASSSNVIVTIPDGAIPGVDAKATVIMTPMDLITDSTTSVPSNRNTYTFKVISEAGAPNEATYTLIINRAKSDDAHLTGIAVWNAAGTEEIALSYSPAVFNPETLEYTIRVPMETTELKFVATRSEQHANVMGASLTPVGDSTGYRTLSKTSEDFRITVLPENEDASKIVTYVVHIVRESNNNVNIKDLEDGGLRVIGSDSVDYSSNITKDDKDSTKYHLTVNGDLTHIDLFVLPESDLSTVTFDTPDILNPDGMNTTFDAEYNLVSNTTKEIKFTVISESGSASESGTRQTYTLVVEVEPKTDKTLSSLTYYYGTDSSNVVELIDSVNTNQREFVLETVPYSISQINIAAVANDTTSRVTGDLGRKSITTSDDGNTYRIVVTAEDGSHDTYVIKVARRKNDDATLSALSVKGYSIEFAPGTTDYEITVDGDLDVLLKSDVTAEATDHKATVTKDEDLVMPVAGTYFYEVNVLAEDGVTPMTYTIKVIKPESTNNYLQSVILENATLSPSTMTHAQDRYTLNVASGETEISITGVPESNGALVTAVNPSVDIVKGGIYRGITDGQEIKLSVQSEDKSIAPRTYTFTIVMSKSSNVNLNSLSVSGYDFAEGEFDPRESTTSFNVYSVEKSQNILTVNAEAMDTNATIHYYHGTMAPSNKIECENQNTCDIPIITTEGTSQIIIQVIAHDGHSSKLYVINYTKVASDDNYLANITASTGTFNQEFNKGTLNYKLNVEESEVTLTFTTSDPNSSIKIGSSSALGELEYTISDLEPGESRVITAVVRSDDTRTRTYTVTVKRYKTNGSQDATLENLVVKEYGSIDGKIYELDKEFSPSTFEYTIVEEIPYTLDKLEIDAVKNVGASEITYLVNGEIQDSQIVNLPEGDGIIGVYVVSEAGDEYHELYKIHYTRKYADNDSYLGDLVISGKTLEPTFDSKKYIYNVTVPEHQTSVILTAETKTATTSITVNGNPYTSKDTLIISGLEPGRNKIVIIATAENGSTHTYTVYVTRESSKEIITSEEFGHIIEDGFVKSASDETSIATFKTQFDNDYNRLYVADSNNVRITDESQYVGTGMFIVLVDEEGEVLDYKKILVLGDINGDGVINAIDVGRVVNHILGRGEIVDAAYLAADINKDSILNAIDVGRMVNHILGRASIDFMAN